MTPPRPESVSSFDTFIATPSALEALLLSRAMAASAADAPRLLLLHGPPGSGKTHLLRAIAHAASGADPSVAVLRTSALECVQEMMAALRRDAADPRLLWPPGGVVTIDDLHVLSEKPATQREIGHLFSAAIGRGTRLACAVGRLGEIPVLVEAVLDWPEARLVALPAPSPRDLRRILGAMARAQGLSLTTRTLDRMAARCRGDVRRAAGAITRRRFEASGPGLAEEDWPF